MTAIPSSLPARENPFRVSRVQRLRYRLDERGWRDLLDNLAHLDHRAALVGPEGSGKTTLLEELERHFEQRGRPIVRVRLRRECRDPSPEEWSALERAGKRHLVTVDGVEQLARWRWRRIERLSRRAAGIVVTSHRPGRLPTLRQHRTDPSLLRELVAELVGREQTGALTPELDRLFEVHRGNLRTCLRGLYDQYTKSC
ncbi:MAG: hypothetical protein GY719_00970 [bacterium]|nr:hypothetical protein [bacterium]